MPEPMRAILIERTWHQVPFAQIGARRGITAEAARKAWARAVREMHRVLLDLE
jgi:DNA-directed RNA polymerase specialized sigma24 family protein